VPFRGFIGIFQVQDPSEPRWDTYYVYSETKKDLFEANKKTADSVQLVGHVRDITWYKSSEWTKKPMALNVEAFASCFKA